MKYFYFALLIFASCKYSNDFKKTLVNNSKKSFWNRKDINSLGKYVYHHNQFEFNSDGYCNYLTSPSEDRKGTSSIINVEGASSFKWSYNENDSTLTIADFKYKVVYYSRDSILLKGENGNKFVLVR